MNKSQIKIALREGLEETITKVSIFDFDGTLVDSPIPDGRDAETNNPTSKEYKENTGQDWPFKGWWGRGESLDMEAFNIPQISSTIADYNEERSKPNTLVVMMTGRIPKISEHVEKILNKYNLKFDDYIYNNKGATLDFKIKVLEDYLTIYPNLREIEMWEDRVAHTKAFREWGANKNIEMIVNQV